MIKFILPLRVKQSKKKMFSCNLNTYRNTHYRTLNAVKINFKKMFFEKYGWNQRNEIKKCRLCYTIYFKDNRLCDLANVGTVVDKFASDCLVEFGYIKDDNRKHVKGVSFADGGIDKHNPRAELCLFEIK